MVYTALLFASLPLCLFAFTVIPRLLVALMPRCLVALYLSLVAFSTQAQTRIVSDFNKGWKFYLGDTATAKEPGFNDAPWRALSLPHDWSIEGNFSDKHPATPTRRRCPPVSAGIVKLLPYLPMQRIKRQP
jgi:hypothetical protein